MALTAARGLSMSAPHADGCGMGPETLDLGKSVHGFSYLVQAVAGKFLNRYEFYEIENTEAAAEAGLPASWQNVVGTGGVITRSLRRVVANEDGSCVSNEWYIFASDCDVLRGKGVCPVAGLLAGYGEQNGAPTLQGFPGDRVVERGFFHVERDSLSEGMLGRNENG